jgi:signal peptidase II
VSGGEPVRVSAQEVRDAADRRRRREARSRWTWLVVLAGVVLVADQAVKIIVRGTMDPGDRIEVLPFLDIVRVTNEGIAFSLFTGNQTVIAIVTVLALTGIAVAMTGLVKRNPMAAVGAGLLAGGALGNLVDRVLHGGVTDFVKLTHWPAFNIADMAITAGAILIVLGLLETSDHEDGPT